MDEKGRYSVPTPGGTQETWIVNEAGLYNVILRSELQKQRL
nr:MAG TPA: BRO family protein [Caudoviricetes sp.]